MYADEQSSPLPGIESLMTYEESALNVDNNGFVTYHDVASHSAYQNADWDFHSPLLSCTTYGARAGPCENEDPLLWHSKDTSDDNIDDLIRRSTTSNSAFNKHHAFMNQTSYPTQIHSPGLNPTESVKLPPTNKTAIDRGNQDSAIGNNNDHNSPIRATNLPSQESARQLNTRIIADGSELSAITNSREPTRLVSDDVSLLIEYSNCQKTKQAGIESFEQQVTSTTSPLKTRAIVIDNSQVTGYKPKRKSSGLNCYYCDRSFNKNFDLQQHVRCHTGEKPFQCVVCGRGFAQKSNVKKHMQVHKVWPELPTRNIVTSTQNNSGLRSDVDMIARPSQDGIDSSNNAPDDKIMTVDSRFICSYCPFNGKTYFELKSHLTLHKREKVFKCTVTKCGKTFSGNDLDEFLKHVSGHKNELIYSCHLCVNQFRTLTELSDHQAKHVTKRELNHADEMASHDQSSSICENVSNSMTKIRPTNSAKPERHETAYHRCPKCMNRYTTSVALEHHLSIASHHHPCTKCKKVFACERNLRRHLNSHAPVLHFCAHCDKQFKTATYLKMHSIVHTGEKPYRCDRCDAAFNRRDKLSRHKLTHESVKRYKCPLRFHTGCSKEFNRPDKLKAHMMTHSGLKPHQCDQCDKSFSRRTHLREHKRSLHSSASVSPDTNGPSTPTGNTAIETLKLEQPMIA